MLFISYILPSNSTFFTASPELILTLSHLSSFWIESRKCDLKHFYLIVPILNVCIPQCSSIHITIYYMCTYTLRYDVCNNFSEIKVNYVIILIVMNDNEEECDNLKLTLATETRLLCW